MLSKWITRKRVLRSYWQRLTFQYILSINQTHDSVEKEAEDWNSAGAGLLCRPASSNSLKKSCTVLPFPFTENSPPKKYNNQVLDVKSKRSFWVLKRMEKSFTEPAIHDLLWREHKLCFNKTCDSKGTWQLNRYAAPWTRTVTNFPELVHILNKLLVGSVAKPLKLCLIKLCLHHPVMRISQRRRSLTYMRANQSHVLTTPKPMYGSNREVVGDYLDNRWWPTTFHYHCYNRRCWWMVSQTGRCNQPLTPISPS